MFTTFYPLEYLRKLYVDNYDLILSDKFISCAETQLPLDFEKKTGIKLRKIIGLAPTYKDLFFYNNGEISNFAVDLGIHNYATTVTVNWQSKSGRIYETYDEDIDCNDIEFWFEGLNPLEHHKQLNDYGNTALPFKLKDLSYELVVTALNMDMTIEMNLKEELVSKANDLIKEIDKMMDGYNEKSMKNDRKDGVVHNWKKRVEDDKLIYDIDTGSAGAPFLKKLLVYLSKMEWFTKVEVS